MLLIIGFVKDLILGNTDATDAAKIQSDAAMQALDLQRDIFQTGQESLQPFAKAGLGALGEIQALLGLGDQTHRMLTRDRARGSDAFRSLVDEDEKIRELRESMERVRGDGSFDLDPTTRNYLSGLEQSIADRENTLLDTFQDGQFQDLGTPEEQQQAALAELERDPTFQAMLKQGEDAILANASATGGLRGGNTQQILGRLRPQLLDQQIQRKIQNLGNILGVGQASAAGGVAAGQNFGAQASNLLNQAGAATAGGVLGQGQLRRQQASDLIKLLSTGFGAL